MLLLLRPPLLLLLLLPLLLRPLLLPMMTDVMATLKITDTVRLRWLQPLLATRPGIYTSFRLHFLTIWPLLLLQGGRLVASDSPRVWGTSSGNAFKTRGSAESRCSSLPLSTMRGDNKEFGTPKPDLGKTVALPPQVPPRAGNLRSPWQSPQPSIRAN